MRFKKFHTVLMSSFFFSIKLLDQESNTMKTPILWKFQDLLNDVSFVYWESAIS